MARRVLLWNPQVHNRFEEVLVFFLIRVEIFDKVKLTQELTAALQLEGLAGYRIYQLFGLYDLLLRVWMPRGREISFESILKDKVRNIAHATTFVVHGFRSHWVWGKIPLEASHLNRLQQHHVETSQQQFRSLSGTDPIPNSLLEIERNGLLRFETLQVDSQGIPLIRFFIFLKESIFAGGGDGYILERVEKTLDAFVDRGDITRTSTYEGAGAAKLLIKGEAKDIYKIGEFIVALNHELVGRGTITVTHLVAEPDPVITDEIGRSSFRHVEKKDLAVAAVIPEIYQEQRVSSDLRTSIEQWVRATALKQELPPELLDIIRICLCAVMSNDESVFSMQLFMRIRGAESYLRDTQVAFISKATGKPDQYLAFVTDAIAATKRQKDGGQGINSGAAPRINPNLLTLGDRISVYRHAAKTCSLALPPWGSDAIVNEGVALRNLIAHNDTELIPSWEKHLSTFVAFWMAFSALRSSVESYLNPPCSSGVI